MSRLYVQHDYAVTGRDYVETDGGDTPAGGISYSTEEQDTGLKWIDDKNIYQITIDLENAVTIPQNTTTSVCSVSDLSIDTLVNIVTKPSKTAICGELAYIDEGYLKVNFHQAWLVKTITLWYTKTE